MRIDSTTLIREKLAGVLFRVVKTMPEEIKCSTTEKILASERGSNGELIDISVENLIWSLGNLGYLAENRRFRFKDCENWLTSKNRQYISLKRGPDAKTNLKYLISFRNQEIAELRANRNHQDIRTEEIDGFLCAQRLERAIHPKANCIVIGPQGVGKSYLLNTVPSWRHAVKILSYQESLERFTQANEPVPLYTHIRRQERIRDVGDSGVNLSQIVCVVLYCDPIVHLVRLTQRSIMDFDRARKFTPYYIPLTYNYSQCINDLHREKVAYVIIDTSLNGDLRDEVYLT